MSKTIHVTLSQGGINKAIKELENYQRRIERNTSKLVDELVKDGADVARSAFDGWAAVDSVSENGFGIIEAVGKNVVIAEFGAGLATMEHHPLADNAPVPVYKWSYSELAGSGEGFETSEAGLTANGESEPGYWHFGNRVYTRVEPRHGMLDARDYIMENAEEKARRIFK